MPLTVCNSAWSSPLPASTHIGVGCNSSMKWGKVVGSLGQVVVVGFKARPLNAELSSTSYLFSPPLPCLAPRLQGQH